MELARTRREARMLAAFIHTMRLHARIIKTADGWAVLWSR